ncbi:MAG: HNH endonuclease, partial [Pseudarthrobacter sp.]|nr:HNH endonuclease [Pseudarthrobacter sp.]
MEISGGSSAAMEGLHASVAALDALFAEDAGLTSTDAAGVDVLQRQYEIRLERLAGYSKLEAMIAAAKAQDAAE